MQRSIPVYAASTAQRSLAVRGNHTGNAIPPLMVPDPGDEPRDGQVAGPGILLAYIRFSLLFPLS
jgi:hypothetical protein